MTPKEYLKRPYHRCFVPDLHKGFTGYIREFPGCLAEGDTLQETWAQLEVIAVSWIEAALDLGQTIPEPLEKVWGIKP